MTKHAPRCWRTTDPAPERYVWCSSILWLLIGDPAYMKNPLRQDLWRAGHAHAAVWLVLALVALRYVDEANLSDALKRLVRISIPVAAILVAAGFFFSVVSPDVTPRRILSTWSTWAPLCWRLAS
jgi:hypothetical protein